MGSVRYASAPPSSPAALSSEDAAVAERCITGDVLGLRIGLDGAANVEAALVREVHVEQDEVRILPRQRERLGAGAGLPDTKAIVLQYLGGQIAVRVVVVHNQDGSFGLVRHALPSGRYLIPRSAFFSASLSRAMASGRDGVSFDRIATERLESATSSSASSALEVTIITGMARVASAAESASSTSARSCRAWRDRAG